MSEKYDKYGNWIDFPDKYLSDMTIKGIISHLISSIVGDCRYALTKYYYSFNLGNVDANTSADVIYNLFFEPAQKYQKGVMPALLDMFNKHIDCLDDMVAAVYGLKSNEHMIYREFARLCKKHEEEGWDEDFMWNDNCYIEL